MFYKIQRYWFFPTFLSCGRPYSQGNPADGPSERSGPAIQKPNRAGNTHFGFCCSNSSNFILYFPPDQKGNLNSCLFLFKFVKFWFLKCVCMCVCVSVYVYVYTHECSTHVGQNWASDSCSWSWVMGDCEPLDMGARNWTSTMAANVLNHWTVSPANLN